MALSATSSAAAQAVFVAAAGETQQYSARPSVAATRQWRGEGSASHARLQWTAPRTGRSAAPGSQMARHVAMQDSMGAEESLLSELGAAGASEYPPGMVRFETMVVLRPDVTDDERLAFTQRYEEFLVAGGAMFVEMFNRGMQPLAYNIKTKNMGGVLSRYLDGIYLLFMYVTKPDSQKTLQAKLNKDDDVIRSTTFRLKL